MAVGRLSSASRARKLAAIIIYSTLCPSLSSISPFALPSPPDPRPYCRSSSFAWVLLLIVMMVVVVVGSNSILGVMLLGLPRWRLLRRSYPYLSCRCKSEQRRPEEAEGRKGFLANASLEAKELFLPSRSSREKKRERKAEEEREIDRFVRDFILICQETIPFNRSNLLLRVRFARYRQFRI